ncbi:hypothetical protein ASE01_07580 [Nocardioides sp. Root190]|uniref:hypothetical protein n=1 Tax=Nocardioides sp. Root190 TaxID=1736488 RepID=UPI0006F2F939|nr:hypothetical protein [Nocardioides sp. Root190]KRB78022.1 hypothetical protein ASE01_07580 [Nocardioides sp. Root190]
MKDGLHALRGLVLSDGDLAEICTIVLTVLAHGEPLVETLNFNEVDVTVDRPQSLVRFEGILSVNDEVVELAEDRFVELASTIAQPLTGDPLAQWQTRHERRVWPMPPASG